MTTHKLFLDDAFDDVDHTLIAFHCSIEDYRLAYLINKYLEINLKRKWLDLDYIKDASYSIFEWKDTKQFITWNLVSNICKTETIHQVNFQSLFNMEDKTIKITHLIPEYKRVNYFLKIDTRFDLNKEKQILETILSIPQVSTAYSLDINELKSKDNLIFC